MNIPMAEIADRHSNRVMDLSTYLFQKNRAIFLMEPITDELAGCVIQQLLYLNAIGSEDITLIINSPGGSVSAGLAIYDAMRGIDCDVSTVCIGMAASMGAFLLAAGAKGKRYATPHSEIMIHQVMGGAQGQAVDVEIAAVRISRVKAEINGLLAEFTGQPLERIQVDTDRDYFLTAKEAVEYGMIDKIQNTIR